MKYRVAAREGVAAVLAGLGLLAIGVLVYVLDRLPESVYFLPVGWSLAEGDEGWFGSVGGQLPGFIHVYAFGLLTAAFVTPTRRFALLSCAAWWTIDSLFEAGQHPAFSPAIAATLPRWFEGFPYLENTGPYFVRGTFDPLDLVAIAVGGSCGRQVV